jgi:hypothetical protein
VRVSESEEGAGDEIERYVSSIHKYCFLHLRLPFIPQRCQRDLRQGLSARRPNVFATPIHFPEGVQTPKGYKGGALSRPSKSSRQLRTSSPPPQCSFHPPVLPAQSIPGAIARRPNASGLYVPLFPTS